MKKIKEYLNFELSKKIKILVSVVFVIGLVSGIMIGGRLFAYAQQFIDSFLDTSRVANTWNVEVDTANGEVKLAQRSCDNTVWFCDMTWRCPGLMGDGSQLLVRRVDENKQWKIWNNDCNTPECGLDGGQAGDMLTADNTFDFSAYYPARQACKAVGGRLPTVAELQCIFSYKSSFGNNFSSSTYYWNAEEYSTTQARVVSSYNNSTYYYGKTDSRPFRCVRGW
ncbi:MAG: hypothetical protein ACWGHO_04145 [Candidatus Moraniibacteriota bacterium]